MIQYDDSSSDEEEGTKQDGEKILSSIVNAWHTKSQQIGTMEWDKSFIILMGIILEMALISEIIFL